MRHLRVTLCLAALLLAAGVLAQEKPEFTVKDSLSGAEIPEFYLYSSFFKFAHSALGQGADIREHFLRTRVGVLPGSEAEKIVERAVIDGYEILSGGQERLVEVTHPTPDQTATRSVRASDPLHPDSFQSEEAYMAAVRKRERDQARELGRVLGRLEADLETEGISTLRLHRYVTERLAASSSMESTDEIDPDHHVWQVEHSFEVGREVGRKSAGTPKGGR